LQRVRDYKVAVDWNYVYWFNICMIVLLSVAAFGMALAAILTQPLVNQTVETLSISGPITITSNSCDTYFQLEMAFDDMHIALPAPSKVTGCNFTFAFVSQNPSTVTPEITFTSESGQFLGTSWTDTTMKTSQIVKNASVLMLGQEFNQMSVISDGTNFRLTYPAIGVSNLM